VTIVNDSSTFRSKEITEYVVAVSQIILACVVYMLAN